MIWLLRAIALAVGIGLLASGRTPAAVLFLAGLVITVAASEISKRGRRGDRRDAHSQTYSAPVDRTLASLRSAIDRRGYRVLDEPAGAAHVVRFNSGASIWSFSGQNVEASVVPTGDGGSEVTITSEIAATRVGHLQSFSWGEGQRIAKRLCEDIDAQLQRGGSPAA